MSCNPSSGAVWFGWCTADTGAVMVTTVPGTWPLKPTISPRQSLCNQVPPSLYYNLYLLTKIVHFLTWLDSAAEGSNPDATFVIISDLTQPWIYATYVKICLSHATFPVHFCFCSSVFSPSAFQAKTTLIWTSLSISRASCRQACRRVMVTSPTCWE